MKSMNYRLIPLMLVFLLMAACGSQEPAPTPTAPPPTATDVPPTEVPPAETLEPTPTEVPPTETPEPTPTETPEPTTGDVPDGFVIYESEASGISIAHPSDWILEDDFSIIAGTDQAIIDEGPEAESGAVVAILSQPPDDLGEGTIIDQLLETVAFFDDDGSFGEAVRGPEEREIQGQSAAIAQYESTNESDIPVSITAALVVGEENAAFVIAIAFPQDDPANVSTVEAVIDSILLSAPVFDEELITVDPLEENDQQAMDETILVELGEVYEVSVPGGFYQEFVVENVADQPLSIVVEPVSDDADAVVEVYDPADPSFYLQRADSVGSGGAESLIFIPNGEESISIRVLDFFTIDSSFSVTVLPVDVDSTAVVLGETYEGTLSSDVIAEYVLEGVGGIPIEIVATQIDDLDLIIEVWDDIRLDRADSSFSESETLRFTPPDDGRYSVRVTEFSASEGAYEISFSEIVVEQTAIEVGQTISGEVPTGAFQDFVIDLTAETEIVIEVAATSDDLDLVLEVYDEADLGFWLDRVDEALSGEAESLNFTPVADGRYVIRVLDFFDQGGPFEITITQP